MQYMATGFDLEVVESCVDVCRIAVAGAEKSIRGYFLGQAVLR